MTDQLDPRPEKLPQRVWESIQRDELPPRDDRGRMRYVMNNLVLHLHPSKVARPTLKFTFWGLYGGISAATPAGVSFANFITPLVVNDQNTGDVNLGGTVSPTGAPAIGGSPVVLPSLGLELDIGNSVQFTPLLGGESIDITDREVKGSIRVDQTAAQEVSRFADVLAATLSSVSLIHGTAAGNKVLVHSPSAQFINPAMDELNKRRLQKYDLRLVPSPSGSGNDELRLVFY